MTPAGNRICLPPTVDNGGPQAHCVRNGSGPSKAVDDMVNATHGPDDTESELSRQGVDTNKQLESSGFEGQGGWMLSTAQLLKVLEDKQISQRAIADALGIAPPRVSELYAGRRHLRLDEAKKLVERFGVPESAAPSLSPLSLPVARLLILHAAQNLGMALDPEDPRIEELAKDYRAFSAFAADPRVRESADAAGGFLQGMRLGRTQTT